MTNAGWLFQLVAIALTTATIASAHDIPLVDNDAGSGSDAPESAEGALLIALGQPYSGGMTDLALADVYDDYRDWYAFAGTEGQHVVVHADAAGLLYARLADPDGNLGPAAGPTLTEGLEFGADLHATGTWFLQFYTSGPARYEFRID